MKKSLTDFRSKIPKGRRQTNRQESKVPHSQRDQLAALFLSTYTKLFSDNKLGLYPHHKLHLELVENARPVH